VDELGATVVAVGCDVAWPMAPSEYDAPTRLFTNRGATPGLRVRVIGPAGNPTGIGTQMRLRYGGGEAAGPVREIQAGSGDWSENGAVEVLGRARAPTALWVRWPGGGEATVPLAQRQRGITLHLPTEGKRRAASRRPVVPRSSPVEQRRNALSHELDFLLVLQRSDQRGLSLSTCQRR